MLTMSVSARAGDGALEDVRLRHEERRLVAAPRVAVQRDVRGVDDARRDRGLHRGHDGPHGRHARIVHLVHDVRLEHRVPSARVDARVERLRLVRDAVAVQDLRALLVDVDDGRVLLARLVVRRQVERALQRVALVASRSRRAARRSTTHSPLCCGFAVVRRRGDDERRRRHPVVREVLHRLSREDPRVGVAGARERRTSRRPTRATSRRASLGSRARALPSSCARRTSRCRAASRDRCRAPADR